MNDLLKTSERLIESYHLFVSAFLNLQSAVQSAKLEQAATTYEEAHKDDVQFTALKKEGES